MKNKLQVMKFNEYISHLKDEWRFYKKHPLLMIIAITYIVSVVYLLVK